MSIQTPADLHFSETIPANIDAVWQAWTTEDGVKSFLAPACKLELTPGGPYEMYFDLEAPAGFRGGEGCKVLAIDSPYMLSFSWNAPPELPAIRSHYTHVIVRLISISSHETLVQLTHDGWGITGEWQKGIDYFRRAWGEIVLPRLKQRFITGPQHWV